jgi:hypothetical protein
MSNRKLITVPIKELDLEMIQPNTQTYKNPKQTGSKLVVIGKPGCFGVGTLVLMYDGSKKRVENVKKGDLVMGDDSTPRKVLSLCHNTDKMYNVYLPGDEQPVVVNNQHLLTLKDFEGHTNVLTVEDYLKETPSFKSRFKWYRRAVEFKETMINNPYKKGKTIGERIKNRNLDVNTRIDDQYLLNTYKNRMSLRKGIMDMIGWKSSIACIYPGMTADLFFLLRGLGVHAKISEKTNIIVRNEEMWMNEELISFKLQPIGEGEYFGFELDGNHQFLLGNLSVVHNTGKSVLISSILYSKKHIFPCGMAMSGTEDTNEFYSKIFPPLFIYNEYSEEPIKNFVRRQKLAKKHLDNPWNAILVDDCTDDPKVFNRPVQHGMYKRGRHWKKLYIVSLQYCMDFKPVIRTNTDGVFILREPNIKIRKAIWENYASIIPDFSLFCEIMDNITGDYTALYIHNFITSNKMEDCIFYYKATPPPDNFKVGCKEFWEFSEERYNPNYVPPLIF